MRVDLGFILVDFSPWIHYFIELSEHVDGTDWADIMQTHESNHYFVARGSSWRWLDLHYEAIVGVQIELGPKEVFSDIDDFDIEARIFPPRDYIVIKTNEWLH